MKLIQELLTLTPEEEVLALFEDLGALKVIDPELLKAARKKSIATYAGVFKTHGDDSLADNIGRDSEIVEQPAANLKAALNILERDLGKQGRFVAGVLKYGDDQVLIAVNPYKLGRKRDYKDPDVYVVRTKGLESAKSSFQKAVGDNGERLARGQPVSLSDPKLKKVISVIGDQAKQENVQLSFLMIGPDLKRSKEKSKRESARAGRVPLPREGELGGPKSVYNRFIKDLRDDVRSRFDKFKSSRVKHQFDKPEDMLKGLLEQGFVKKLKFAGFTYDQSDYGQNFRSLLSGEPERPGSPHVYISYKLNTGSPEAEELKERLKELRDELSRRQADAPEKKDELWQEYYERRKEVVPPGELKIALGWQGGALVPTTVVFGDRDSYLY